MLTKTHTPINLATWTTAIATIHPTNPLPLILGSALVALVAGVPDVDNHKSKWGRRHPKTSALLERHWEHRESPTHWAAPPIILGTLIGYLCHLAYPTLWWIGAAIGGSWLMHLLADTLTYQGVQLFKPFTNKIIRPRYGHRIQCGGKAETVIRYLSYGWLIGSSALALL